MVMHYKEIHALGKSQKEDNSVTHHSCGKDTNQSVSRACKTHGSDDNSS